MRVPIPNDFNWREFLYLYSTLNNHPNYGKTERNVGHYFEKYGIRDGKLIKYKVDDDHHFRKLNLFNYLLNNKDLTFDDVLIKDKLYENYFSKGIRNDKNVSYNLLLSNKSSDEKNIILKNDFTLIFGNRTCKIDENLMKLINPELIIIENMDEWKVDDLKLVLDTIKSKYVISLSFINVINGYEDIIKNAYITFTDNINLNGTNVISKNVISYIIEDLNEKLKRKVFNIITNNKYYQEYVDLLKNYEFKNENITKPNFINIKCNFSSDGFIINTEKMVHQIWIDMMNKIVEKNTIIDFCKANSSITHNDKLFLPCVFHNNCIWSYPRTYEYDIGFVGTLSIKRKNILDKLKDQGYKLNIIQCFGEERDKEISKCKLIVNIHFNDNHQIFEYFRCSRIVFNKIPIVSENVIECDELDINKEVLKYVSFTSYDDITNRVKSILDNYDKYVSDLYKDFSYDRLREFSLKHINDFKENIIPKI